MKELHVGTLNNGAKFTLPYDLVTRTLAVIGIRGWGKTVAATVIAEEMCEAGLPWIAIDPVGVWWGLRCNPDGSPGGYPIVIIGGEHADLPLSKECGAQVADAIVQENVSCIIDMSNESKTAVRHFVADFCDRLMELRPTTPRHIFFEEAPELVPQKPMGEQKRSLAAVDRLIRLGRNRGYGATLISQRTATIQKDVLTQCESLIAGRSIVKPDRVAMEDWIAEVVGIEHQKKADAFIDSLTGLESGSGWFWSPQWLGKFMQVQIRARKTYHPGATRTVGQATIKQVQLSDVRGFVERFSAALAPTVEKAAPVASPVKSIVEPKADPRDATIASLRAENQEIRTKLTAAQNAVAKAREHLEPQYQAMKALFGDIETVSSSGGVSASDPAWKLWIEKLGGGPAKFIALLLERTELTRVQLQTLGGYSRRTAYEYIQQLRRNQLIKEDGGKIRLRSL